MAVFNSASYERRYAKDLGFNHAGIARGRLGSSGLCGLVPLLQWHYTGRQRIPCSVGKSAFSRTPSRSKAADSRTCRLNFSNLRGSIRNAESLFLAAPLERGPVDLKRFWNGMRSCF